MDRADNVPMNEKLIKSDCQLPSSNPRQTLKNRFRLYFQVSKGNVSQELPYSWFDQITLYYGENLNYQTLPKMPIATVNYYSTFAADGRKIRNARGSNTPNNLKIFHCAQHV